MPPGFFFARNAPQASCAGTGQGSFPGAEKTSAARMRSESSTAGSATSKRFTQPAGSPPPFPSRAAKLRRGNRSSQRRSAPTAKIDKGSTLRSLPTANADTPLAGIRAPAGLLRKQMREPTPFTPAHAHAAAQHHAENAVLKAHPRLSLRKSRHRQHQKLFMMQYSNKV